LKIVEFSIIGAKAKSAVLLRDSEDRGLKVTCGSCCATALLFGLALAIIKHDVRASREHGDTSLARPWSDPKWCALPRWCGGHEGLIAIMLRGGLDGATFRLEPS
jgi:hypothetical protein